MYHRAAKLSFYPNLGYTRFCSYASHWTTTWREEIIQSFPATRNVLHTKTLPRRTLTSRLWKKMRFFPVLSMQSHTRCKDELAMQRCTRQTIILTWQELPWRAPNSLFQKATALFPICLYAAIHSMPWRGPHSQLSDAFNVKQTFSHSKIACWRAPEPFLHFHLRHNTSFDRGKVAFQCTYHQNI